MLLNSRLNQLSIRGRKHRSALNNDFIENHHLLTIGNVPTQILLRAVEASEFILLVERAHFLFPNWCSVGFWVGLLVPILLPHLPYKWAVCSAEEIFISACVNTYCNTSNAVWNTVWKPAVFIAAPNTRLSCTQSVTTLPISGKGEKFIFLNFISPYYSQGENETCIRQSSLSIKHKETCDPQCQCSPSTITSFNLFYFLWSWYFVVASHLPVILLWIGCAPPSFSPEGQHVRGISKRKWPVWNTCSNLHLNWVESL